MAMRLGKNFMVDRGPVFNHKWLSFTMITDKPSDSESFWPLDVGR